MDSNTIRQRFFSFFAERGHARVPSASLIPNDRSLLLTNAGMVPFKPYFLGEQTPPFDRMMSVQKVFRAVDIDEVGKDTTHLTFFEMLGNFSFGDYFKEEACPWAWQLITEAFEVDADRLWVSVYKDDDEAEQIWIDAVGVPPERVVRRDEDNFWSMGVAGPCGPDSEIFFDRGERFGPPAADGPVTNDERYIEIWNLVFMQNECNEQIEPVRPLPKKNIDTGTGVERLAVALQGVASIFETDTIFGIVRRAAEVTGREYGSSARVDSSLRILADHGRAVTFLIDDGVLPSNQERGYVLRRVLRRAVRQARLLGYDKPILPVLVDATLELMGEAYPETAARRDFIVEVASREEERFDATLRQGLSLLEGEIAHLRSSRSDTLGGEVAFKLHDTFGFPIDLTREIASEAGIEVDAASFATLMSHQRDRARAARHTGAPGEVAEVAGSVLEASGPTDFAGYEHLEGTARILAITDGTAAVAVAEEGSEVDLILDRTVFYAEGGGQVGDRGVIRSAGGRAEVADTRRLLPGLTGHRVRVASGELAVGDEVALSVDPRWRTGSERAHTATHILHWVLRDRLGEHATQAGSLVEPGRLRFDFHHFEPLGAARATEMSAEIQERVFTDDSVRAYETSYDFARSIGAMAIFGEKYGDFVRVVEVGEYSKELCGGTHVPHTSQIGVVVLTSEGSIGANIRRVGALVGRDGLRFLESRAAVLQRAADALKAAPDEVAERIEKLLATQKELEQKIAAVERKTAEADAAMLAKTAVEVDGTRLVAARRDEGVDQLRALALMLKGRLGSAVIVLGTAGEGRANLVGAVTSDLIARGLSARDVLAPAAALLGGGAGGKPDLSISGGPSADHLGAALEAAADEARRLLGALPTG
ncbi:MAG: alanyl-tRNA synthetase [Actinomycetota bacterium]|nr:alanyl-tRNA synthetase [Actinomycetota bacterium]